MKGALLLSKKHVRDVMTDIRHVYWLTPSTVINASKIDEIKEHGWSRIPVFNDALDKCYGILLVKQLLDIDFDDETPRVDSFDLYPCKPVGSMTALDTMFRKFIHVHTHLLPVEHGGKFVGIITIEDLIEEILGHEIEDEKD
jgi:CBS domain containing-hemolysin-like protein